MRELDNFDIAALLPLLYLLGLLYVIAALIVWPFGFPLLRAREFSDILSAGMAIAFCGAALYIVRQMPPGAIAPAVVKAALFSASVVILTSATCIATVPCFAIKPAIPLINGHHYDQLLLHVQQNVFDGISPGGWLIARATDRDIRVLDFFYNLFAPFFSLTLVIAVYVNGLKGGVHLSIAQFMGLFICLLIALIFPTRGPLFEHPTIFLPKLADTMSGELARYLMATTADYARDPSRAPLLAGIAAMPSYHVYSWGCALIYWRYLPRWAFVAGILACAMDWLSTVALGWHYALDGVVALLLVFPVWKLAAYFIQVTTPVRRPPARAAAGLPEPLPSPASIRGP